MKEYKLFVQRIGLVGVTNMLVALNSIILLPILTKSFSISDYGIWVQIFTTITLIPNIATLGLPFTMIRFLSTGKKRKEIQEGFYSILIVILIVTSIISILFLIFSNSISLLFNGNTNILKILTILIFFASINLMLMNYFRTLQQFKKYSIFLLIQTYIGSILVSYFALSGFSIDFTIIGLLIGYLVSFILMAFFIISEIGIKIPEFKNVREYLSFGLPTIPGNLSYWIVDSSDRYLIGILLSTTFVGYYSPGYALGNLIILLLTPFSFLLPSLLPKYYDNGNVKKVNLFLKYSLKYYLIMAIPAAFGVSMLSKSILMILTTPEIASEGYLITPFVALSALLFGIYAILGNIIILKKKTKIIGAVWFGAAILNICLNTIFIPYFGIIGAAAVTLISYTLAFSFTIYYSLKYFKFSFDSGVIIKSIVSSSLMSLIIAIINPKGILNIVFIIGICAATYFILLLIFGGLKTEEFKFFKGLLKE